MLPLLVAALIVAAPAAAEGPLRISYVGGESVAGARLGLADNATTGRFTGQRFELSDTASLVVADLRNEALLALAGKGGIVFNIGDPDDALRGELCRRNLLHVLPSRAMLADALVQFLVAKRWTQVLLVVGRAPDDEAYAAAIRRAAKKFRARIVAEKRWAREPGARRSDTGHVTMQDEVAAFTQGVSYDVLVVADTSDDFGEELPFRTFAPRPVAGTHGLVPVAWSPVHEQWGASQLQNRFRRAAGRAMTERDWAAWVAVRAIGEAATRAASTDPETIVAFIRGERFALPAFKGVPVSFRPWDGQMRQPILLAQPRALISVSPQPGYLHERSELDTLGIDRPETACRFG